MTEIDYQFKDSPIKLLFDENTDTSRMAEMILILSDVLGEDLTVLQVNDLFPDQHDLRKFA